MKSVVEGNKELDFKILEKAANAAMDKMRADEVNTDLYDQFQYRPDIIGSQRYYIEPYKSAWGSLVEQFDFIPLPQVILDQYSAIECASFMGIIPELNRVWVTVDNKLYIWNYYHPEECQVFDAISEVIVSVSLSAPKPGVFMDTVKYVLVVASPIEVIVLAVSCDDNRRNLRLIPTIYKLPSDNVTMFKVIGSQSGRIFMAGNDGNLYELDYTNANRSWASAIGVEPPHKCRKINRFAWNWKLIHILPPFLRAIAGSSDDSLAELAVDNVRNVLYLATSKGVLSVFYLGPNGDESHFIVTAFNIFEECRAFLSNNRNTPDSSPKADCFMDSNTSASNFVVIALHVIPIIESRKAHLVVVLGNGIRIYLSLRTGHSGLYSRVPTASTQAAGPTSLEIAYVRSPPSINAVKFSNVVQQCVRVDDSTATDVENGSVPSFTPSQSLNISNALYSHGTVLMSIDKSKQPDELLVMYEDHLYRSSGSQQVNTYQPPTLKEGISVILDGSNSGGKIYDIKEDCTLIHNDEMASLLSLYTHSATPSTNSAIRDSSHHYLPNGRPPAESRDNDEGYSASDHPVIHSQALARSPQSALPGTVGYDRSNLDNVAILGEMTYQVIPSSRNTLQRQFLVLTNQGLHILKKLRPIDVLYRNLAQVHTVSDELTRYFFTSFNPLQASAMCIALSCGVPCDAGGSGHIDPTVGALCSTVLPLETIQKRAMSVLFALTSGPSHREAISGRALTNGTNSAVKDSRVVLTGSSPEFFNSVAHDALFLTFGRLVRPVWLRPILHEASVDSMWTVSLITQVRAPILQFLNVLKGFFPVSVLTDPHKIDFLTTLDENPSDHLVTGQLHNRAKTHVNVERTLQQKAKNLEDVSINSLYRLASRTCHALSFLEILLTMTTEWHIPVDWSRLGDISFRTLVTAPRLHDRVKKMINIIINSVSRSEKTQIADRLIDWLSNECYHYFSAGDRYVYEASKLLDALRKLLTGDQANNGTVFSLSAANHGDIKIGEIQSLSTHCVQLLCSAAKYWHTLESVNAGGDEELNTKCSELLELNSEIGRDGVVDLCLLVAENFRIKTNDKISSRVFSSRSIAEVDSTDTVAVLDNTSFDASFYHGGTILTEQDRAVGIKACYTCLINHIIAVGRDIPHLGEGMVAPTTRQFDPLVLALRSMHSMILRAVSKCNDDLFHDMLYATLFKENRDQLFLIRTSQIERYLKETDPTTLYGYYEHHKEHPKAANLMSTVAHDSEDLDIELRISYLQKAVVSAERAATLSNQRNTRELPPELLLTDDSSESLRQRIVDGLVELKDTLDIAGYQLIAFKKLSDDFQSYNFNSVNRSRFNESQRKQLEQMERQVHRLRFQLVGITELFHECMLYRLWDVCLMLLNISKHNDQDLIARLWRSFIYRIVPDNAVTEEVQSFLKLKREPNRIDIDKRHQRSDVTFEDASQWKTTLENELTELGQALHTSEIAFPVVTILDELEEIAAMLVLCQQNTTTEFVKKGWAYHCFVSMGFSHVIIMESYMELFDLWSGKIPEKILHIIVSVTAVLLRWTRKAIERDSASVNETRQLIQYSRSGTVRLWLEKIRRQISTLSGRGGSLSDDLLEETNNQILEVNRRVNELTYV